MSKNLSTGNRDYSEEKLREDPPPYFHRPPIVLQMEQIGIGMSVTTLPVILSIKNRYQDLFLKCHEHHLPILKYFIDENNLYPFYDSNAEKLETDPIFIGSMAQQVISYNTSMTIHAPHQCHPVDHYFHLIDGRINVPMEERNYPKFPVEQIDLSRFNLPKKFVTIGPGTTKTICQLPAHTINDIITYCKNKGYEVVILGGKYFFNLQIGDKKMSIGPRFHDELDLTGCIDLIHKTTLDEAIAILDKSHCYIGPEGGLMQFCGMTDTPMIIGINGWTPEMRMPYRHNELGWEAYPVMPDETLKCRFCIENTIHARTVNIMMQCLYDDYKCVEEHMTFENFKPQLDKVL